MALQKQSVPVNFSQGLDLKTDPNQVSIGKFLSLTNSVFTKGGALTKRNGFANITTLPNALQTTLTTLNDNLLATGSNLYAFNEDNNKWLNQGIVQPVSLNTLPLVRVSTSQSSPDAAIAPNGLICLTYMDSTGLAYFQVSDSVTGQQIVQRTSIASIDTTTSAIAAPRAFLFGNYFLVTYLATISGTTHLRYIAIPVNNPTATLTAVNISSTVRSLSAGYDANSISNTFYMAWASSSSAVMIATINLSLVSSTGTVVSNTHSATLMSVVIDNYNPATPTVWVTYYDSSTMNGYLTVYSQSLVPLLASAEVITGINVSEITSLANNSNITVFYEVINTFASPYPESGVRTDYVSSVTCTITGTVGAPTVVLRSVGLASKAILLYTYTLNSDPQTIVTNTILPLPGTFTLISATTYMLVTYGDTDQTDSAQDSNQPTYFLIDSQGNIYLRLAYSNGGGYEANEVLPTISFMNNTCYVPYQFADLLVSVNKGTNNPVNTASQALYTQLGINLAKFSINESGQFSSEIAGALHLTGGMLWMYDGTKPVEHNFHVWPENIQVTTSTTGGNLIADTYYYQFTYEWTDNAGNLHRSAPSIPVSVITGGTGAGSNTLYVPTLRLTYKQPLPNLGGGAQPGTNPVRIVGYRWSILQPVYYQFTSVTAPIVNDPTVDFVVITDVKAQVAILGNTLLYTTGGVVEDIAAPASIASALFKNRLFLVDAEDQNLLWYSKQVIEAVPVEMSDLFTLYVAPTSGAQGSTGPVTALSAMDDKLIIFKKDAIYYLTGTGPDNTGANNDFTDPIFITSSVGCSNPSSIVLMPNGLMFQSDKGIWLLGRDLSTNYIGAPVEAYNTQTIESAQAIPATNQVRFLLGNNITLMYDYYYNQWGTFSNTNAISATLYQGEHTYLSSYGQVFQETPGIYLDGTQPVLMAFTTSWLNVAGLRGYERFYYFLMLGTYYTPFKLNVQLAYDYAQPENAITVTPDNQTPNWGGDAQWGSNQAWGGIGNVFQARVFPRKMKCQTFQISVSEIYDSSYNQPAGQGLTMSGLNLVVGLKKGYSPQKASRSFG